MQHNELRTIPGMQHYFADADGSLWSDRGGLLRKLSLSKAKDGHLIVNANGCRTAASLVCAAFHGVRPDGCFAGHKNGVPTDNRAENLEWQPRSVIHTRDRSHVVPDHLKPIPNHPGYYADAAGDIWSARQTVVKRLKSRIGPHGYRNLTLSLGNKLTQHSVHALVCSAFHGVKPDGMCCRHLNGDPLDNRAENLTWGTTTDNAADRRKHGNEYHGEKHHNARFNLDAVRVMRNLYDVQKWSACRIAKCFDVQLSVIHSILKRKSWKHIDDSFPEMEKLA